MTAPTRSASASAAQPDALTMFYVRRKTQPKGRVRLFGSHGPLSVGRASVVKDDLYVAWWKTSEVVSLIDDFDAWCDEDMESDV